ncbi:MAG TPA: hypothetical protein DHV51_04960, partial [Opitutae bacterium]|nr:hypothetical protein [Opitutae bacterium]
MAKCCLFLWLIHDTSDLPNAPKSPRGLSQKNLQGTFDICERWGTIRPEGEIMTKDPKVASDVEATIEALCKKLGIAGYETRLSLESGGASMQ